MSSETDPYGKQYFDHIFRREQQNSHRNQSRLKMIYETHNTGNLLEIGCGQGDFLRLAAQQFNVEGIDISRHAVESLKGWGNGSVRRENVEQSQLGSKHYEVVVAFNVLEHLREPAQVIEKTFASLKPGGVFVGSMPLNTAILGRIHTGLTNIFDRTHVATYSPDRWNFLFNAAGFQPVEFFGEMILTRNYCHYVRKPGWKWLSFNLMFRCMRPIERISRSF